MEFAADVTEHSNRYAFQRPHSCALAFAVNRDISKIRGRRCTLDELVTKSTTDRKYDCNTLPAAEQVYSTSGTRENVADLASFSM